MELKDTLSSVEKIQLKILKEMGPERRLERSIELSNFSLKFLREGINKRHPEYSEEQLRLAVIRLLLPEKLYKLVYLDNEGLKQ